MSEQNKTTETDPTEVPVEVQLIQPTGLVINKRTISYAVGGAAALVTAYVLGRKSGFQAAQDVVYHIGETAVEAVTEAVTSD